MTMTSQQMRESAARAPTNAQRLEDLEAASCIERQEKEALYGKAAPLVLELQQKLAESERATVRERRRAEMFEARAVEVKKAITDATGCDVSRWACGFDGPIRAAISRARQQVSVAPSPIHPNQPAGGAHVCSGCGEKGFTANCNQCIPY
ncbi:hypothetical protein Pfra02_04400 [Pseudomonas fragi]|nr:hypothetical protein Pfra02_04400 [Pseudomonas fragi]